MILKWLQQFMGPRRSPTEIESKRVSNSSGNTFPNQALIDIAHEVLAKEALEKKLALSGLEKYGWPLMQRQMFQQKVKTRVKRFLNFSLSQEDDVVEEVTERITEAAEVDPHYKRLFEDADEKR